MRTIKAGIDMGSFHVKVAIAERTENEKTPRLLGIGMAEARGMRHGYIVNPAEAESALRHAVAAAEKSAGIKIKRAYLSVGGVGLGSIATTGGTMVTRADTEITGMDVLKATQAAEQSIPKPFINNRRILHSPAIEYRIDGKPALSGSPIGMKGVKLEVKNLCVTVLEHHVNEMIQVVENVGIEVESVIAAPFAASTVMLTRLQKMAGCVLANIGAESTSLVVFENNAPVSMEVLPLGSMDITNDIALGLRLPIEEAEEIKIGGTTSNAAAHYSRKKLEEIVEARLSDIFDLIDAHLRKLNRSGLLPAGIIMTGGGSHLEGLKDFARNHLKLPAKIASVTIPSHLKVPIRDATWGTAYGLCVIALSTPQEEATLGIDQGSKSPAKSFMEWLSQFLP